MPRAGDACFVGVTTAIGAAHLGLMFLGLALYATPESLMVSTVLERHPEYRAGMQAFAALEFLVQALFAARFSAAEPCLALLAAALASAGLAGWLVLSERYEDAQHFSGVALFIAGEASAYAALFALARRYTPYWEQRCDGFVYADGAVTLALVVTYVGMYLGGNLPGCWAVEHAALVCYATTFTFFFALHPCNPWDRPPPPSLQRSHHYEPL